MSTGGIASRVFGGILAFLLLWANFEAWFCPEKVMRRMQEDHNRLNGWLPDFWPGKDQSLDEAASRAPWLKSIAWYRAFLLAFDILAIPILYLFFTQP